MNDFTIINYDTSHFDEWNSFIGEAKNATFLFHRNFMDYHQDRFEDYSLMIYLGDKLVAVFPAHRISDTVYSHQGLSYGGLVCGMNMKMARYLSCFESLLCFFKLRGVDFVEIKEIPFFYDSYLADELGYLAFLTEATLVRRDILSVVDLQHRPKIERNRRLEIKNARKRNLRIEETDDLTDFWNELLIPNLWRRHQCKPVHTLEEISLLKRFFPQQIRHFNVYSDQLIAGLTVFVTDTVVHLQYISGKQYYNNLGGLDLLQAYLMEEVFADKKFYDFGNSNVEEGRKLNRSLMFWKESFGARTTVQSFYRFETEKYKKLQEVWL